jgi:dTDP-4-amino-4,6-dideoxygalactose transaminase
MVPGSSTQDELEGTTMPANFLTRLSESQARLGTGRLHRLHEAVGRRRQIAHAYSDWFIGNGRAAAVEPAEQEHAFLRYPLRVIDRRRFIAEAEQAGIDIGDWFVSPVHPVVDRLERWGYVAGTAPIAERACDEIVNLPTDPALGDNDVEQVITFLAAHEGLIR